MLLYRVWCPEHGESVEDGTRIEASNAEEAAEDWAEHEDNSSAEYHIVGKRSRPVVCVQAANGVGAVTQWLVRGEAVPSYYATEICSACRSLEGEHTFGAACTYKEAQ